MLDIFAAIKERERKVTLLKSRRDRLGSSR